MRVFPSTRADWRLVNRYPDFKLTKFEVFHDSGEKGCKMLGMKLETSNMCLNWKITDNFRGESNGGFTLENS